MLARIERGTGMTQQASFGRRGLQPAERRAVPRPISAPVREAVHAPAEPTPLAPDPLSPEAEAFRTELASGQHGRPSEFELWRRSQRGGLALIWLVRLAFLTPGAVSAVLHAPPMLSLGFEVAGIAAGIWIRQARRKRRADIVAWSEPEAL